MKQYKLYLFDLDGTLIDSDRMLVETFKELYSKYRPGYNPDNSHYLQFSGPPIAESLKKEFPNLDQKAILEEYHHNILFRVQDNILHPEKYLN